MAITWLKLHNDLLGDIKLRRFTPQEKWAWIAILILANQSSDRGYISADDEDIADACEFNSAQDWLYYRDKLISKGMLEHSEKGLKVLNWEARQYRFPSDRSEAAKERKRRSRANQKAVQKTDVTSGHESVTSESRDRLDQIRLDTDKDLEDPIQDILSVQQAETDPVATENQEKEQKKGTKKGTRTNNRNKADVYKQLSNPEDFESFWKWYADNLAEIPPDRDGYKPDPGPKKLAAVAWHEHIEKADRLAIFREGCRSFKFKGCRGLPHASRFIKDDFYLKNISAASVPSFVSLTGQGVSEMDRSNWLEEMRQKGQKFYRGPDGSIDQERAKFFHEHSDIFEEAV
jgi:hypothetical protein